MAGPTKGKECVNCDLIFVTSSFRHPRRSSMCVQCGREYERLKRKEYLERKSAGDTQPRTDRSKCNRCGCELTPDNINNNPEKKGWRCIECCREHHREYQRNNREKFRAANVRSREKLRRLVLSEYGNRCKCCGESSPEFLAIDHVDGGGNRDRKNGVGSDRLMRIIRDKGFPPDYRILCHNCNMSRGFYGYCPHKHTPLDAMTRLNGREAARA